MAKSAHPPGPAGPLSPSPPSNGGSAASRDLPGQDVRSGPWGGQWDRDTGRRYSKDQIRESASNLSPAHRRCEANHSDLGRCHIGKLNLIN